ncbi:MAG: AMP-binding protein [Acidobacteria bacterium]|nr:AMP-binding protein [Acidobacteriota bacterium]
MKQPESTSLYPIKTLRDLILLSTDQYGNRIALQSKQAGAYVPLTYRELLEKVERLACGFFRLGLRKGDRVGLLSENCTEWALCYLAAVGSGLTAVPIDKDLKPPEICHILSYSESKALVCASEFLDALQGLNQDLPHLERIITLKAGNCSDRTYQGLLELGYRQGPGFHAFREAEVDGEDIASIIFTSGTTGSSKAVMLTHRNIAANIMATSQVIALSCEDVVLSVLPLHHTYECTCGFLIPLYQGCSVCHAESLRRIPDNLRETRASVMLGVPLLFETMYRRIEAGIREAGEWKFKTAKLIASGLELLLGAATRRMIFRRLHQNLGGRFRLCISGGAAIDPRISRGFRELGICFIQGYGMTEASPIIAVNRLDRFRDEAAGIALPGVEIKIVDGEILVRGPNIMKGYYRNELATREALQEGWLYTGDLGFVDGKGFLHITGRKKSVIVTPNGKNVYPEEVEYALNQSPYILESVVWGGPEEEPAKVEVQAIVVPRIEVFDRQFGPRGYDEEKVRCILESEIKRCCQSLANYKRVKSFVIRNQEFEKTTTRKIKRYLYTGKPRPITTSGL